MASSSQLLLRPSNAIALAARFASSSSSQLLLLHVDDLFRSVSAYANLNRRNLSSDFTTSHLNRSISLFHLLLKNRPSPSIVSVGKLLTSISRLKCHYQVVSLSRNLDLTSQNVFTLSILINSFLHLHHLGFGFSVFGKLFKLGFFKVGNMQAAKQLLLEMRSCQVLPNLVTYNAVMDFLCKHNNLKEALALLHDMEISGKNPDIVSYSIIIGGMCRAGKIDMAREMFSSLPAKGVQLDVRSFTIFIKGLCKEGLVIEAEELLGKMEETGCSPNGCTYNTMAQGFFRNRETAKGVQFVKSMVGKGFSADVSTTEMYFEFLCKEGSKHLL